MIDEPGARDGVAGQAVIEEPLGVRMIEEPGPPDMENGDRAAVGRTAAGHEPGGMLIRSTRKVEIAVSTGLRARDELVPTTGTRTDRDDTGGLVVDVGRPGPPALLGPEKHHVGSDIDDRAAAAAGGGQVQDCRAGVAGHGRVHVQDAGLHHEITKDRLGGLDIQGALVHVGGAGGLDLTRQVQDTVPCLGEDARPVAVDDV